MNDIIYGKTMKETITVKKYNTYKNGFLGWKRSKRLFQELPFYNVLSEKPRVKHLKNIDLLHELPFYDDLSIAEILKAFKTYARSYKVEIIDSKDFLAQLEACKSSIKDLFKYLLDETKGFKNQVTVNALLKKTKSKWRHRICSFFF